MMAQSPVRVQHQRNEDVAVTTLQWVAPSGDYRIKERKVSCHAVIAG
jgi:hypothetical protein